jgi:hypothetical protein
VRPDQRAIITSFGRAERLPGDIDLKADEPDLHLSADERERYRYPRVRVVPPGGPYFKWPWQQVHKVSISTQALDLSWDRASTAKSGSVSARIICTLTCSAWPVRWNT